MYNIKKIAQRKLKNLSLKLAQQLEDKYVPLPSEKVFFKSLADGPVTFNLFIPSLDKKVIFGGIATAIAFIKEFQDAGFNIKITTFDFALSDKEKQEAIEFLQKQLDLHIVPKNIQVVGEFKQAIPLKQEIFVATMYYTASFIHSVIKNNAFSSAKFIYFIQDFEPGFFPWSDEYAKALSSYRYENTIPIFNSSLLRDFFVDNNYATRNSSLVFKPKLQTDKLSPRSTVNAVPKVLFYARPQRPRNLYQTGLQGLIDWLHEYRPQVEIYTAGQSHDDIQFEQWTIRSMGKMDADHYWKTLNQYDIGLSLMLSPHPSYPPIEMAMSGLVVVTNRYANKDLANISDNFVTCEPSAEGVKLALQEAYSKSNDMASRVKNAGFDPDKDALTLTDAVKSILQTLNLKKD
jgi:hypothetical protein